MSHITTVKSKVKFVDLIILQEVLEEIARETKGKIGTTYTNWNGSIVNRAAICISIPGYKCGIGFEKAGLEYIPKMDNFLKTRQANGLMTKINQCYQRVAYKITLKEMGYMMSPAKTTAENVVELYATRY